MEMLPGQTRRCIALILQPGIVLAAEHAAGFACSRMAPFGLFKLSGLRGAALPDAAGGLASQTQSGNNLWANFHLNALGIKQKPIHIERYSDELFRHSGPTLDLFWQLAATTLLSRCAYLATGRFRPASLLSWSGVRC